MVRKIIFLSMLTMVIACLVPIVVHAGSSPELSSGEMLYVAVYSNVYAGPKAVPYQLAAMLSIHNIDPKNSITLVKVDYYDSNGKFIENYLQKPVVLKPLAHTFYYLKEYDTRGGPGANFIVKWRAERKVNQPVVEAIMYGARAGISFTSKGQIIHEQAQ